MSNKGKKSGETGKQAPMGTRSASEERDSPDASALLADLAGRAGIEWRPGDDPSALLTALEDADGGVPEAVQEVLALVQDAAEALERGLAGGQDSDKKA